MDGKVKKSLNEKCLNFARFADYFVICGLDAQTGLEVDLHAGELQSAYSLNSGKFFSHNGFPLLWFSQSI